MSSFSGTPHSTTQSLEPSSFHFPRPSSEMPKSRTFTKYKQTCAQAKMSKNKPRSMWQGTLLSLQPCLYSSFTKWVALQDFFLPQDFDPLKNVAELMVPVKTFKIQSLPKTESGKLRRSTRNDAGFTGHCAGIMGHCAGVTTRLFFVAY